MKSLFFSLLAIASLTFFLPNTAFAQVNDDNKTIVDVAVENENFSTLAAAVKAADLTTTLSGDGPFTVFAPTNAAFEALPDGLVEALLKPENKEVLQKIFSYHVVANELNAEAVTMGIEDNDGTLSATTVEGGEFTVMTEAGKVKIKDAQGMIATVTQTDIMGNNGVIHVIDRVLLPANVDPASLLKAKAMGMKDDAMNERDDMKQKREMAKTQAKDARTATDRELQEKRDMVKTDATTVRTNADRKLEEKRDMVKDEAKAARTTAKSEMQEKRDMVKDEMEETRTTIDRRTAEKLELEKSPVMTAAERRNAPTNRASDLGPTIADVATGNDDFSTLTTALGAAGLTETFGEQGEYTVFAPTNAAFDALPEGTVNDLVTNQKEQLKGILSYHVIPSKITAAQLTEAIKANKNYYLMQTLGGETIIATIKNGNVQLIDASGNRSTVVSTDVEASNGIIHGIDTVVMPK